jgi:hypothetical protein
VAVIQTGGNVDSALFAQVLRGATPTVEHDPRAVELGQLA